MKTPFNNLDHLTKCPVCNSAYRNIKTFILKEEGNRTALHITCNRCNVSTVVFVSMNKIGIVSLGVLTDLKGEEAKKFFGNEVISEDCVIEVHEFLKNFKGEAGEFI